MFLFNFKKQEFAQKRRAKIKMMLKRFHHHSSLTSKNQVNISFPIMYVDIHIIGGGILTSFLLLLHLHL